MLMLSTLHNLLSQVLSLPMLHTAILLTPTGDLVSVASDPSRPKDEVRIIAGLAGELWQETRDQGYGMVDSEVIYAQRDKESILTHRNKLGRIVVLPVEEVTSDLEGSSSDNMEPPLLLTLNSSDNVSWDELETKGKALAIHLAKPLSRFRDYLAVPTPTPITTATTSPAAIRS